jgi:hypothetical protein
LAGNINVTGNFKMSEANRPVEGELVAVENSINQALAQITKAEIDQQIATAHAYPRSMARFKTRAIEMATLDEETAESCIYARPVGKKKDETTGKMVTEYAEGMSIRMAEIVGACYGNLRVGAMLIEMNPRYVKARGVAHDLESNFLSTSEVIESTVDRNGKPYSERMRAVVAKAALSKARRDATFQVVPKGLAKPIEAAVRAIAVGDTTTLDKRRARIMQWVDLLGIDPVRVFRSLNVTGVEDLTIDHLATLQGIRTALKDKETTVDEAFPTDEAATEAEQTPPKNTNAPPAGSTTAKAKNALKRNDPVTTADITALKKAGDQAGVGENALIEKFQVDKLESLTRDQYEEAMRYVAGLLAEPK